MKIAYHFNADHGILRGYYGPPIEKKIFQIILNHRSLMVSSKIFVGDLQLHNLSYDIIKDKNSELYIHNKNKHIAAFEKWQNPENFIWRKFLPDKLVECLNTRVFIVCFESIDLKTAEFINSQLESYQPYLGAFEVDESSPIHWALYGALISPFCRLINKDLFLFYQDVDAKDYGQAEELEKLPFNKVAFECLNFRYTIFDTYTSYEEARRIAEWKRNSGALLAFIADDIVSRLSDIAPDLSNKLWAALKTFEEAETNEQLAEVTASCRRIFEYVTDSIFPPSDEVKNGHSLMADKYKNRLFEYADSSRKSDTNIDLIIASTELLFEQWERLNNLSNKGVHSEVFRSETRRCLLRTIMLLDDIVSLKEKPFEIKPKLNFDSLFDQYSN